MTDVRPTDVTPITGSETLGGLYLGHEVGGNGRCTRTTSYPTVNDDSTAGYAIGSRWIHTTSKIELVCVDASAGAAVWKTAAGNVLDDNRNEVLRYGDVPSAVNEVRVINSATGDPPIIESIGDDFDIPLKIRTQGGLAAEILISPSDVKSLVASSVASGVHYVYVQGGTPGGGGARLGSIQDGSPDSHLRLESSGAGEVRANGDQVVTRTDTMTVTNKDLTGTNTLTNCRVATGLRDTNTNPMILWGETASAVNGLTITNAATAGRPKIAASGSDTDVVLELDGQGTGGVRIADLQVTNINDTSNDKKAIDITATGSAVHHLSIQGTNLSTGGPRLVANNSDPSGTEPSDLKLETVNGGVARVNGDRVVTGDEYGVPDKEAMGPYEWRHSQLLAYPTLATAVTNATNATPIVVTAAGHGLSSEQVVTLSGVGGNNAANTTARVTVTDVDTFSLDGTTGDGAYTSGGVVDITDFAELGVMRTVTNGTLTALLHSSGPFVEAESAVGPATTALFQCPTIVRRDWEVIADFGFRTANMTGARFWAGLFESDPTGVASPTAIECAAFRYDAATDGSTWRAVTSDGATVTATDTGAAVASSASFRARIETSGSLCRFAIQRPAGGSSYANVYTDLTTNLPASSTNLTFWILIEPSGATTRFVKLKRLSLYHI